MSSRRSPAGGANASDPSWRGLYRAGSVSAALYVVFTVAAIVLSAIVARPPLSGGAATLEFIAENRTVYPLEQILWMWPNVFAMVVFLTLYVALKHLNRSYAALGALIGGAGWALGMANPTTNFGAAALVYLSDQYAAATTDAQRAAFSAAAETLIAQNNTPSGYGILTPVGILIVSLVMVKGVFHRGVAYLGIATGVLGIASEAFRFFQPAGYADASDALSAVVLLVYAAYGLLILFWFIPVGWMLHRLAGGQDQAAAPEKETLDEPR
jgi:Domain of unknown function (DUF4386)